jgi:hypothetical protein
VISGVDLQICLVSRVNDRNIVCNSSGNIGGARMNGEFDLSRGCNLPPDVWAQANAEWAFQRPDVRRLVADFPSVDLMQNVSGLVSERDFAAHGAHFWLALNRLAAKPLSNYQSILDLGCGCGRLGRMLKGHAGRICGCDIDSRHVDFVAKKLPWMSYRSLCLVT